VIFISRCPFLINLETLVRYTTAPLSLSPLFTRGFRGPAVFTDIVFRSGKFYYKDI